MKSHRFGDLLSTVILSLASALGLWAFIRPMLGPPDEAHAFVGSAGARAQDAPLILVLLLVLCLLVIVANLETRRMDARVVAALGILVGINASLRLISGPFGSSAMFFLPILCGYVFGADFGFLLASLSVLTSALLTGGIGPWLPFQMFATGWCGMVSGWLPRVGHRTACVMLALWGGLSGFLFGFMTNLWFWPYLPPADVSQNWQPGLALTESALRYVAFYVATSSWWDAGRALGTAVLLLTAGGPSLRLLRRFQQRFRFQVDPGREEQISS